MNKYNKVYLYINGNYIGSVNNPFKYRIGCLNSFISKKYYKYNPIILKDKNNNIITDDILKKMVYNGICNINVQYA